MVTMYPHTIVISSVAESTQDGNGNFVAGGPSTVQFKGRYEPNVSNRFVTAADGKQIVYTGIVYAPLSAPDVALGTSITISEKSITSNVVSFDRSQRHVTILIG
jgi:hypothetical protein